MGQKVFIIVRLEKGCVTLFKMPGYMVAGLSDISEYANPDG